jgi:hypothetical protein
LSLLATLGLCSPAENQDMLLVDITIKRYDGQAVYELTLLGNEMQVTALGAETLLEVCEVNRVVR